MARGSARSPGLGIGLVLLALFGVVASYPPPAFGGGLVEGYGVSVPLIVSVVALLLATAGGVLVGLRVARQSSGIGSLAISALGPVVAVAMAGGYLSVVAGFDPGGTVGIVGLVAAGVIGAAANLLA